MVREARIIAALAGQDVPVPAVLGVEEDASVTGAPFFVMQHVAGAVLRTGGEASVLTPEARHEASLAAVDTLVALHALDPDAIGLGDLARRDGYLERQLARWSAQLSAAATRPLPDLLAVHERLVARLPEQRRLTLVHGDFRLDNLIVDAERGSVAAVLDWELATLGDPLADLGLLLVYWGRPGTASGVLPDAPTALEGFAHPEELIARYAAGTGEDAGELAEALRPYIAFSLFKLACILEGVRVRTIAGAYGALGQGSAMGVEAERYLDLVPELARRALAVLTAPDGLGEASAPLR
jgi:aminoglycoside phosphotransferase (APT) family kinase protein